MSVSSVMAPAMGRMYAQSARKKLLGFIVVVGLAWLMELSWSFEVRGSWSGSGQAVIT